MTPQEAWEHLRDAIASTKPGCSVVLSPRAAVLLMEQHNDQVPPEAEVVG